MIIIIKQGYKMILIIIFTDEDLHKIKNRDPDIFEEIFKEYNVKIYNFLLIKTSGNTHIAEEILSETFYSALESAPKIKNAKNIFSWLLQIAYRRLIDYYRGEYKEKKYIDNAASDEILINNETDEDLDDSIKNQKVVLLNKAMENIPEKYKKILKLKYIEKKSQKEIAGILKKSRSSVESLLYRARESLKKEIKKFINKEDMI